MSFDPSDEYGPDRPPPSGRDPYLPAPGLSTEAARERVRLPAIFLIVLGALNLLAALGCFGFGAFFKSMPADKFEKMMEAQNPGQLADLKKQGWTVQDVLNIYIRGGFGEGVVALVASLVTILGGVRMLSLKNYGFAVLASVVTAVPCISPSACCIVGIVIGIWSVVVLMNPDVRGAFR
jgi:hypothetical protein